MKILNQVKGIRLIDQLLRYRNGFSYIFEKFKYFIEDRNFLSIHIFKYNV